MRIYTLKLLVIGLGVLFASTSATAHHSFAAEFDANQPLTVRGNVTRVAFTNPHVWIYLNVKDDDGNLVNWGFEMGAPHQVRNRGWDRNTLKTGDEIIVEGYRARNGSPRMNARNITWADTGLTLGAASSIETTP